MATKMPHRPGSQQIIGQCEHCLAVYVTLVGEGEGVADRSGEAAWGGGVAGRGK